MTPSKSLITLFQLLANLQRLYTQEPFGAKHIQQTLAFSDQLIQQYRASSDIICAQAQLQKTSLPTSTNLIFNCCVHTCLLSSRNRVNDTSLQQMIAACVSALTHATQQQPNQSDDYRQNPKPDKRTLLALSKTGNEAWHDLYITTAFWRVETNKHLLRINNPIMWVLHFAWRLTVLGILSNKESPGVFAHRFRKVAVDTPPRFHYLLESVLSYPGLIPPGSLIQTHAGELGIVLSKSNTGLLMAKVKPADNTVFSLDSSKIRKVLPSPALKRVSHCDLWWSEAWEQFTSEVEDLCTDNPQSYRIDKPPPSLMSIQKLLQGNNVDIDKLASLIESEPVFSEHVKETATKSSRQGLSMKDARHGLMMHGYARTGSLLMQQALIHRLNQRYFPLQQMFLQFTQLRTFIAAKLAEQGSSMLPEQMAELSAFASAGLFTLAHLKTRTRWQRLPERWYDIQSLANVPNQSHLQTHATKLAGAWQLPSQYQQAIQRHAVMPDDISTKKQIKQMAVILGLSLLLARKYFFNDKLNCRTTEAYERQACVFLGFSAKSLNTFRNEVLAASHAHCPLEDFRLTQ